MKNRIRQISVLLCIVMTASVLLAGCRSGASGSASSSYVESPVTEAGAAKNAAAYDSGYGVAYDSAEADEWEEEAWEEEDTEDYPAEDSAAGSGNTGSSGDASAVKSSEEIAKKIVYSGDLSLETTEYEKTIEEMKALMAANGAIISNSSESDSNSSWYRSNSAYHSSRTMTWNLRIPAKNFTAFFEGAGQITGSVRGKNTYSSDMTRQYNDNAVQIESLTIQQNNLMKMMESAETIEDMLAIEDRLTQIRTQLKRLNNSNNQIDYDVDYSQVTVYVTEVYEYPQADPETFRERLARSFGDSAEEFLEFLQDLLISLIYLFPYLVLLAIVIVIVIVLHRRYRAKHPKKERRKKKVTERQEYGPVPSEPEQTQETNQEK